MCSEECWFGLLGPFWCLWCSKTSKPIKTIEKLMYDSLCCSTCFTCDYYHSWIPSKPSLYIILLIWLFYTAYIRVSNWVILFPPKSAHMYLMAAWCSTALSKKYVTCTAASALTSQNSRFCSCFPPVCIQSAGWKIPQIPAETRSANCLLVHMIRSEVFLDWTPCSSVHLISPEAPLALDWHRLGSASLAEAASSQAERTGVIPETY